MSATPPVTPSLPNPPPGAELGRWNLRVWMVAGPIILANVSGPLLGAVDTAVMGTLPSPDYIGGVAVGAVVFDFLFWAFSFLRMGTTGFTAQAYGAGERDELRAVLARPLLLALVIGTLLILLQTPIRAFAFHYVEASDGVAANALLYFQIRIWAAPAALVNFALVGWLIGTQRTGTVFLLQLLLNGVNILLDLLFVLWLGWGIEGVAVASVIAEVLAAGVGLLVAGRMLAGHGGSWDRARILRRDRLLALLRVNTDIMIRSLCLTGAFYYIMLRGAAMGDVTLAANNVLLRFQSFIAFGLDGFAHAAEVLAGGAYGARHFRAFRESVVTATLWSLGLAAALTLLLLAFGEPLVYLFTTSVPAVREAAIVFLPWIVISPLLSVWSFMLDGIFIGTTRTAEMRNAMIVSLGTFLAACWLFIPLWGNHGLWTAFAVLMVVRALTLAFYYPGIERSLRPAA